MRIFRQVIVSGPGAVFNADANLNSASLEPPAPFSGTGTYQRIDAYTTRWEGSLAVSFPGRPDVPLTGRNVSWSLNSARAATGSTQISVLGVG